MEVWHSADCPPECSQESDKCRKCLDSPCWKKKEGKKTLDSTHPIHGKPVPGGHKNINNLSFKSLRRKYMGQIQLAREKARAYTTGPRPGKVTSSVPLTLRGAQRWAGSRLALTCANSLSENIHTSSQGPSAGKLQTTVSGMMGFVERRTPLETSVCGAHVMETQLHASKSRVNHEASGKPREGLRRNTAESSTTRGWPRPPG